MSKGLHHIVFEDGKYRCVACRAVSLKQHIIDEIPCTKVPKAFTEVPKRSEGSAYTFDSYTNTDPFLPRRGDTWLTYDGVFVFVETREGYGWINVDTGRLREGQLPLPGVGFNPAARRFQYTQSYSEEILKSKALGVTPGNEAEEQVSAALVTMCLERLVIQVSPTKVDITPEPTFHATKFTAHCMVIDIPNTHGVRPKRTVFDHDGM